MIDPVSIADERVGDSAQVEQPIPIGVVASQARDFKPQDHAGTTERYFGCQVREAGAFGQAGTGDAEVLVEDRDILAVPSPIRRRVRPVDTGARSRQAELKRPD